jgi:predicted nucleic acid-binding protein
VIWLPEVPAGVRDVTCPTSCPPHLIDSEVTNVLRRLARHGSLTDEQATSALEGFMRLALVRFPADWLGPRIWALRHNLSAYDPHTSRSPR